MASRLPSRNKQAAQRPTVLPCSIFGGRSPKTGKLVGEHHRMEPWIAALALTDSADTVREQRVAPGQFVLLSGDDIDPLMPRLVQHQIWRCTAMHSDVLRFGRYRQSRPHYIRPTEHDGRPSMLRKFTREQWNVIQNEERTRLAATPYTTAA